MASLNRYEGRTIRLRSHVILGQRVSSHLTDEQIEQGPEGIVIRALAKDGRVLLEIDLDNVPFLGPFALDDVRFI
jgi:hypothetical protein